MLAMTKDFSSISTDSGYSHGRSCLTTDGSMDSLPCYKVPDNSFNNTYSTYASSKEVLGARPVCEGQESSQTKRKHDLTKSFRNSKEYRRSMKKRKSEYSSHVFDAGRPVENLNLEISGNTLLSNDLTVNYDSSAFMEQPMLSLGVTETYNLSKEKKKSIIYKLKKFGKHLQNKCSKQEENTLKTLAIL